MLHTPDIIRGLRKKADRNEYFRAASTKESLIPRAALAQKNQQRAGISLMILPAFPVLTSGIRSLDNPANA
jgi:hypothetical protein